MALLDGGQGARRLRLVWPAPKLNLGDLHDKTVEQSEVIPNAREKLRKLLDDEVGQAAGM